MRTASAITIFLLLLALGACARTEHSTQIPLTLRDNSALVNIRVADSDVPVQLDTGNFTSINLSQAVLDRAGAQRMDGVSKRKDAQGNTVVMPGFRVPRLQLGNLVFKDVDAKLDVHDPSYPPYQIGQQGFLGTALLKSYRVVLDYPKRTMTLIPGEAPARGTACHGTVATFDAAWGGEPATLIETDLGTLTLWWDTGAGASILTKRFVEKSGRSGESQLTSSRLVIGGDDFGPWTFQVWDNLVLPPGFDGFIGNDFFLKHVVCMDFPAKRLFVRKAPMQPTSP